MDRDGDAVHGSLTDRSQEARVVRHSERHPTLGAYTERRTHRREGLGDRRVDTAVDDAHRLAHGRANRQMTRGPADLGGVVDDEADRRVERVLDRYSELVRRSIGHEARS